MEESINTAEKEQETILNPTMAETADTIKLFKAASCIQSSPEYLLSGYTVFQNGAFRLEIQPGELEELGLTEKDLIQYINLLSKLNNRL